MMRSVQLWGELSRELGTDGPEFTEICNGEDPPHRHFASQDDEDGNDRTSEEIGVGHPRHHSTRRPEESAMHYEEDGGEEEEFSEDVLHDRESFEDRGGLTRRRSPTSRPHRPARQPPGRPGRTC